MPLNATLWTINVFNSIIAGPDIIKGDGIYSAYVLAPDLSQNGRYNVKVLVKGKRDKTKVVTGQRFSGALEKGQSCKLRTLLIQTFVTNKLYVLKHARAHKLLPTTADSQMSYTIQFKDQWT